MNRSMTALPVSLEAFSRSYGEARTRFVNAARLSGWSSESHPVSARGPAGDELTLDVAISPAAEGSPGIVISSGLHGVEGFLGSAVQLQHLQHWGESPCPRNLRIVMLHALNPYGFVWLRRCDEQNRDLNRSFLLEGEGGTPPESELYRRLNAWLNPASPPRRWDAFLARGLLKILRYGYRPVQNAIAGGQYEFPQGLFFGGGGASELQRILALNLPRWIGPCDRVIHLDFHSGLGKWADLMLLLDNPATDLQLDELDELDSWVAPEKFRQPQTHSKMYQVSGSLGRWCCAHSGSSNYVFAVAEFGTYNPFHMLRVLRNENREHHWGIANQFDLPETIASDRAGHLSRAKADILEAFRPRSASWRTEVLDRSFKLINRIIAGLALE